MNVIDIASWVCLLAGSFFAISGGVGLLRFPDFFSRLHPAGVKDTMGAWLILLGLMIQAGFSFVLIKLVLIAGLLMVISPTATHALAKSALLETVRPLLHASIPDDHPH